MCRFATMEGNTQTPYSRSLGRFVAIEEKGKWLWKLDGDEWEGAGMDGSGKFSQNPQILHFEVKM